MNKVIVILNTLWVLLIFSIVMYQGKEIDHLKYEVQQCRAKEYDLSNSLTRLEHIQDQDRALKVEAWK